MKPYRMKFDGTDKTKLLDEGANIITFTNNVLYDSLGAQDFVFNNKFYLRTDSQDIYTYDLAIKNPSKIDFKPAEYPNAQFIGFNEDFSSLFYEINNSEIWLYNIANSTRTLIANKNLLYPLSAENSSFAASFDTPLSFSDANQARESIYMTLRDGITQQRFYQNKVYGKVTNFDNNKSYFFFYTLDGTGLFTPLFKENDINVFPTNLMFTIANGQAIYVNNQKIYKHDLSSLTNPHTQFSDEGVNLGFFWNIGNKIYYRDDATRNFYVKNTDGTGGQMLQAMNSMFGEIKKSGLPNKYIIATQSNGVWLLDTQADTLVKISTDVWRNQFAVKDNLVYYKKQSDMSTIYKFDLTANTSIVLLTNANSIEIMADRFKVDSADKTKFYFTEGSTLKYYSPNTANYKSTKSYISNVISNPSATKIGINLTKTIPTGTSFDFYLANNYQSQTLLSKADKDAGRFTMNPNFLMIQRNYTEKITTTFANGKVFSDFGWDIGDVFEINGVSYKITNTNKAWICANNCGWEIEFSNADGSGINFDLSTLNSLNITKGGQTYISTNYNMTKGLAAWGGSTIGGSGRLQIFPNYMSDMKPTVMSNGLTFADLTNTFAQGDTFSVDGVSYKIQSIMTDNNMININYLKEDGTPGTVDYNITEFPTNGLMKSSVSWTAIDSSKLDGASTLDLQTLFGSTTLNLYYKINLATTSSSKTPEISGISITSK